MSPFQGYGLRLSATQDFALCLYMMPFQGSEDELGIALYPIPRSFVKAVIASYPITFFAKGKIICRAY